MGETTTLVKMAEAPASTPRILYDLERNLHRIAYGFVDRYGVTEEDSYLKQIALEIYIYLRQTQTYDSLGETTNPTVDQGLEYEHVAGIDEALDGHLDITFSIVGDHEWNTKLHKCGQCHTRRFWKIQSLTRHLMWHMFPVVSKPPNDDDKVTFDASHDWLYQFKEKYLWPDNLYTNLIEGMSEAGDSSDSSDDSLPDLDIKHENQDEDMYFL